MQNKTKKIVAAVLSAGIVASLAIGGTLAFLTSKASQTNTFTVGKVNITLTEPKWDDTTNGKNEVPGKTEDKNPTVTISADSQTSYMRVKMQIVDGTTGAPITDAARLALIEDCIRYDAANGTASAVLKDGSSYTKAAIEALPAVNAGFTKDTARSSDGVYYYNFGTTVSAGDSNVLFTTIAIPSDYTNANLATMGNFKIVMEAQAIQAEGFADSAAAFTALQTAETADTIGA